VSGELVYQDPAGRFAFCYPNDMQLSTDAGPASDLYGIAVSVRYPKERDDDFLRAGLYWASSDVTGKPCTSGEYHIRNERLEPYVISGITGTACLQDRYRQDAPDILWRRNTRVELPMENGGLVIVDITYAPAFTSAGRAVDQLIARFLDSTLLN
jgi:hypothetical protein